MRSNPKKKKKSKQQIGSEETVKARGGRTKKPVIKRKKTIYMAAIINVI